MTTPLPEPELISESLKKAIGESGLTSYEVAKRAGVSPQIITRFMRGERGLSLVVVDRIGLALRLELRNAPIARPHIARLTTGPFTGNPRAQSPTGERYIEHYRRGYTALFGRGSVDTVGVPAVPGTPSATLMGGFHIGRLLCRGRVPRTPSLTLLGEFYTGRLIRQGNASISAELAGIFERLGCSGRTWKSRIERLGGDRLLGRFFASTRANLREIGERLRVPSIPWLKKYASKRTSRPTPSLVVLDLRLETVQAGHVGRGGHQVKVSRCR